MYHLRVRLSPQDTTTGNRIQDIYFKEVSEDDEDELTVINSIKLYRPKTINAAMEISKLEKVG